MPEGVGREIEIESSTWKNFSELWELWEYLRVGNIPCAKNLIERYPELAYASSPDGSSTVMHVFCGVADAATVKAMVEVNPDYLCLKDGKGRTLLHSAAEKGNKEVARALVTVCPKSIQEETFLSETAVHLAAKNSHGDCLRVLMEQLQKHNLKELLSRQDADGNTALHIATSREQKMMVQDLVSCKSRRADDVVGLNSTNKMGCTALDLYYQITSGRNDKNIGDILREAGAKKGHELLRSEGQPSLSQPHPGIMEKMLLENIDLVMKSLSLMVFIYIADAAYDSLFNLSNIYPLEHHVEIQNISVEDMIRSPNLLPDVFYVIVANTIAFFGSMAVVLFNTWSLATKWSLCYRIVPLFVTAAMLVSYCLAVKKIMPKFWVTIGPHNIPSFWLAWLYHIALLFSSVAAWLIGKHIFFGIFSKLGYRRD